MKSKIILFIPCVDLGGVEKNLKRFNLKNNLNSYLNIFEKY